MRFLLEFDQIDRYIMGFMREALPQIMDLVVGGVRRTARTVTSMFGEAEVEVSRRQVCKL
jgi:hypothetical protein